MNPWTNQISAQIVNRMQREGVEVVESPFEREWQTGPVSQLIITVWDKLQNLDSHPQAELTQDEHLA